MNIYTTYQNPYEDYERDLNSFKELHPDCTQAEYEQECLRLCEKYNI